MSWDIEIFRLLNSRLTHPVLDAAMPVITSSGTYRLALIVLALVLLVRGPARQRWLVLGVALAVGLADLVSSHLVKALVGRLRPSFSLEEVRLLVSPKRSWSFPSSHAVNLAAATWYLHRAAARPWLSRAMLVALVIISYSRIYIGVHYPSDVLAGALLGALLAEVVLGLPHLGPMRREPGLAKEGASSPGSPSEEGDSLAPPIPADLPVRADDVRP